MQIQFLKRMQDTPKIGNRLNQGVSETVINQVEQEFGYTFPKVYREFLYLGGNSANMIADMNHGLYIGERPYWKEIQANCRAGLAEEGITVDRPFWVFADLGSDQFHFFYLNEGDDPTVYWYCAFHVDKQGKEYAGIVFLNKSFSQYIIDQIKLRKNTGY